MKIKLPLILLSLGFFMLASLSSQAQSSQAIPPQGKNQTLAQYFQSIADKSQQESLKAIDASSEGNKAAAHILAGTDSNTENENSANTNPLSTAPSTTCNCNESNTSNSNANNFYYNLNGQRAIRIHPYCRCENSSPSTNEQQTTNQTSKEPTDTNTDMDDSLSSSSPPAKNNSTHFDIQY